MKKISGIYKIYNSVTKKCYVGSSKNINSRWKKHKEDLTANRHHNQHLQNDWNKYGKDAFQLEVIEVCLLDKGILIEREQYYIDTLKPEYNICPVAGTSLGRKLSDEHKRKISEKLKGHKVSDETKAKISLTVNTNMTEELRNKLSNSHKGQTPWNKGKTGVYSEETKIKMSEWQKGKSKKSIE